MTGETVDCYNCGRANPEWAQVCRSCGVPLRRGRRTSTSSGWLPTDRDSLVSIGAALATIVAAIVIGLVVSGMLPEAAPIAETTPSPTASPTPRATPSVLPSEEASTEPTAEPTPELIGTVTFGTGINASTKEATGVTDTLGPGVAFCHSVALTEPFGVSQIQEEVLRVGSDGSLTVVQQRQGSNLTVNAASQVAGFCAPSTNPLINGWGVGDFVLRDYRNTDTPELIAEGRFTLTN
jgi:hypothetical protein